MGAVFPVILRWPGAFSKPKTRSKNDAKMRLHNASIFVVFESIRERCGTSSGSQTGPKSNVCVDSFVRWRFWASSEAFSSSLVFRCWFGEYDFLDAEPYVCCVRISHRCFAASL